MASDDYGKDYREEYYLKKDLEKFRHQRITTMSNINYKEEAMDKFLKREEEKKLLELENEEEFFARIKGIEKAKDQAITDYYTDRQRHLSFDLKDNYRITLQQQLTEDYDMAQANNAEVYYPKAQEPAVALTVEAIDAALAKAGEVPVVAEIDINQDNILLAMSNFHKIVFKKENNERLYDVVNAAKNKVDYTVAVVEETRMAFKVTRSGSWNSMNGTQIYFHHTGVFKKSEVYAFIKEKKLSEIKEVNGVDVKNIGSTIIPVDVANIIYANQYSDYVVSFITNNYNSFYDINQKITFTDYQENIFNAIRGYIIKDIPKAIPIPKLEKYYLLDNRYIVYVQDENEYWYTLYNKNGNIALELCAPTILGWNNVDAGLINALVSKINLMKFENSCKFVLLDIIKWKFEDDKINAKVQEEFFKQEIEVLEKVFKASPKVCQSFALLKLIPEQEFMNKLNTEFARQGFPNITCTKAIKDMAEVSYSEKNWKTRHGNVVREQVPAYSCEFKYKGKKILPDPKEGGWCFVTNDENLTMVRSAWCQRVSRWSKETAGDVDQRDKWNIVDWLTGPYAEKIGLVNEDIPLLFGGRQLGKAEAKRKILAALKAAL